MKRFGTIAVVLFVFVLSIATSAYAQGFDILFKNGRVYDGSGNPWFRADIAIKDSMIVGIGSFQNFTAKTVIDIDGLYISPGFIDIHSHALDPASSGQGLDSEVRGRREAPNLVSQGITTVIVNQDGRSANSPISEQIEQLHKAGIGVNAGLMIGHNSIRRQALGDDYHRSSTRQEIEWMQEKVREAMEQGSFGLSAGLEYVPGRWSDTEEVIALVNEITPFGGVYISHQRSEAKTPMLWLPSDGTPTPPTLLDAVEETIEIGRVTGATVVASHLKSRGANYWGGSTAAISLIERARNNGVQIYADQYPYNTSGSDGNTILLPSWVFNFEDFGIEEAEPPNYKRPLAEVLLDPSLRQKLNKDIKHSITYRGGADRIVVFEFPDAALIGKSLAEIANDLKLSDEEVVIHLQNTGFSNRRGGARLRSFSMHEDDLNAIGATDWTATTTDGMITLPEDGNDIHARFYGTFPRKIFKYALTNGTISVAHAVRSSTSLPAQIMNIRNRGSIRVGNYADLVVFDLYTLKDEATFFNPHQHSSGIKYVLVNGVPAISEGELTGTLNGRVLTPATSR